MRTKIFLSLIFIATLASSCKKDGDKPQAFTYGEATSMSTGSTSVAGTASPAGFTWSEVKTPQSTWGLSATFNDRNLAEDFQIPSGEKWNIQNFYFLAYQTGFSGTTFPVNEFYFEIYSSDPSVAGAVKVYGDLTTNRFVSAEETKWYRILQGQPSDLTRKIYKMKIQATDLNLPAGTYWIRWTSKTISGTHFYPQLPHDANRNNNLKQFAVSNSTWTTLNDGGQGYSVPIEISGTKLPN